MSPAIDPEIVVLDASVVVSIIAQEATTHAIAGTALDDYTQVGADFAAPNILVSEVLFALCQKLQAGVIDRSEYAKAIASFKDLLSSVQLASDESSLIPRAVDIRESYGRSRFADSLYLALAEHLGASKAVVLLTFDGGIAQQATKNAPGIAVRTL